VIELIDKAFYWIVPAYGDGAGEWTVAQWEVGCFWSRGGREITPKTISGPIPPPTPSEGGEA